MSESPAAASVPTVRSRNPQIQSPPPQENALSPSSESNRPTPRWLSSNYDQTGRSSRRRRGPHQAQQKGWLGNDPNTLLVVATLITTLTYTVGTNPPGGCWQDDLNGHFAGNPIMKDRHRRRYWLFMAASLIGFGNSMLLTLWLLIGMGAESHMVRFSFIISYSSLLLTFISSIPGSSLALDIGVWAGLMLALCGVTYVKRWSWGPFATAGRGDEANDTDGEELAPIANHHSQP